MGTLLMTLIYVSGWTFATGLFNEPFSQPSL